MRIINVYAKSSENRSRTRNLKDTAIVCCTINPKTENILKLCCKAQLFYDQEDLYGDEILFFLYDIIDAKLLIFTVCGVSIYSCISGIFYVYKEVYNERES